MLAQHTVDIELIIVNDGSTDKTLEIARNCAQLDHRVRVIDRTNSGRPSVPRNDGISAAHGDYVCFLDHDDLYDPDRTYQLMLGLDQHPEWVAVFSEMRLIDSAGEIIPGMYLESYRFLDRAIPYIRHLEDGWIECNEKFFIFQSLFLASMHTSTVMIARDRLPRDTIIFDTQFTLADDIDLWIRIGMLGRLGFLNKALSSYRQHPASITRNFEKLETDTAAFHIHNYHRLCAVLTFSQALRLRTRIAGCVRSVAYLRYQQYRFIVARSEYRKSLQWRLNSEAVLGYLKTFLPVGLVRYLKKRTAST